MWHSVEYFYAYVARWCICIQYCGIALCAAFAACSFLLLISGENVTEQDCLTVKKASVILLMCYIRCHVNI